MEKAILKTLIYGDIFNYSLKGYEIHKWLIGAAAPIQKVERALKKLIKKSKVKSKKDYYFLQGKDGLVSIRVRREDQSEEYFNKAVFISQLLKIIPWVKLVGISGGLALMNASKKDDIDFFVITYKKRLWLSRILILGILTLIGQRRKANDKKSKTAGKICLNTIVEESSLKQEFEDLYTAHEVLQMRPLWQRDGIYSRYLKDNKWVFKFLPNWTSTIKYRRPKVSQGKGIVNILETLAQWFQLKIMVTPKGAERIEDGGLYFYPRDLRDSVLKTFKRKIQKI